MDNPLLVVRLYLRAVGKMSKVEITVHTDELTLVLYADIWKVLCFADDTHSSFWYFAITASSEDYHLKKKNIRCLTDNDVKLIGRYDPPNTKFWVQNKSGVDDAASYIVFYEGRQVFTDALESDSCTGNWRWKLIHF